MRNYYWVRYNSVWLMLLFGRSLVAQELLFSQYRMAPLQVNPAEVAASADWRVIAHYRNQSLAGDAGFRTSQFSVMRPLYWGKRRYAGVGVSMMDDRSRGVSWFQQQRVGLSLAYELPLTRRQRLGLGWQTQYHSKQITTEGVRTGSQFRPGSGFDSTLPIGEGGSGLRASYLSLNAGLLWYALDTHEQTEAYAGLSLFNLNRPSDAFFASTASLPVVLQAHSGFRLLERGRGTVSPEFLATSWAGILLVNIGSRFTYRLGASGAKPTVASRVEVIPRYTINRSVSLALQWHTAAYTLGVSYDTDASFNPAENPLRSAFELAVAWHQPVRPKERTRRRKRRLVSDRHRSPASRRIDPLVPQPPTSMGEDTLRLPSGEPASVRSEAMRRGTLAVQQLKLTIEFAFNQSTPDASARSAFQQTIQFLQQQPELMITLTGHADGVGTPDANHRISLERAEAVRTLLIAEGIAAERIRTVGRGDEAPLYPNTSAVFRAKNRRVEIEFSQL